MIVEISDDELDSKMISDELDRFNEGIVGKDDHKKLCLVVRNGSNEIVGGLVGGCAMNSNSWHSGRL